jgi:hypothetical protein
MTVPVLEEPKPAYSEPSSPTAAFVLPSSVAAIQARWGLCKPRTPHHRININSGSHVSPSIAGIPLLKKGFPSTSTLLGKQLPTATEVQACWELCRLHNNVGFWVVWLPTGKKLEIACCMQRIRKR